MFYSFAEIAGFRIEFISKYYIVVSKCKDYKTDNKNADIIIHVSEQEIEEAALNDTSGAEHYGGYYESICAYKKIGEWLPLKDSFILHSAVFDVDGVGIAFAAHSGTGKSTHMQLWQQLLGDKMTVVNGDKPIVRFFDDEPNTPYAYGTPWNGKEHYGSNMRTKLKHICFIERSETNSVEPMDNSESVNLIFNQVYMPKDSQAVIKTIELINRLISNCNLWKIRCNMEEDAAKVAFNGIFENKS